MFCELSLTPLTTETTQKPWGLWKNFPMSSTQIKAACRSHFSITQYTAAGRMLWKPFLRGAQTRTQWVAGEKQPYTSHAPRTTPRLCKPLLTMVQISTRRMRAIRHHSTLHSGGVIIASSFFSSKRAQTLNSATTREEPRRKWGGNLVTHLSLSCWTSRQLHSRQVPDGKVELYSPSPGQIATGEA